jgi:hypothetical protein
MRPSQWFGFVVRGDIAPMRARLCDVAVDEGQSKGRSKGAPTTAIKGSCNLSTRYHEKKYFFRYGRAGH